MSATIDVAIIGAGPYGLAIASHLHTRGVDYRVFGVPMHFWATMSPGMFLKSFGFATNIYTPQKHFTLPEYCRARGLEDLEPIEIAEFARYGQWVQQQAIPGVEATNVMLLRREQRHFVLSLAGGEAVTARRVVIATGLSYFEHMPAMFAQLPADLASHTAQHSDFSRFKGQRVAVIGGGQSALQAAALLHEHDADVELFARRNIWFSTKMPLNRPLIDRIKAPLTVLGPGRENWVLEHLPMAMHFVPTEKRVAFTRKHLGPGGAWWLHDRVIGQIPTHEYVEVIGAQSQGSKVTLRLHDAQRGERTLVVDHVIAGTGFDVDVNRVEFLSEELVADIRRIERAPALSSFFESSVRDLYFVGPASALSFGPLFRFVAGASYTAPLVATHLALRGRFTPGSLPSPTRQISEQVTSPTLVESNARVATH